jgi:hypothetical protein
MNGSEGHGGCVLWRDEPVILGYIPRGGECLTSVDFIFGG